MIRKYLLFIIMCAVVIVMNDSKVFVCGEKNKSLNLEWKYNIKYDIALYNII
jgi:hypothetical protein